MAALSWPEINEYLRQGYSLEQLQPLVSGTQYNQLYFLNRYGPAAFGLWAGPFKPKQGIYRGEPLSPEIQKAIQDYMAFYDQQQGSSSTLATYMQQNPSLGLRDWQLWAGGKGPLPGGAGGGGGSFGGAGGGLGSFGGGGLGGGGGSPFGFTPGSSADWSSVLSNMGTMPYLEGGFFPRPSPVSSGTGNAAVDQFLNQLAMSQWTSMLGDAFSYNRGLEQYLTVGKPLQNYLLGVYGDVTGQNFLPPSGNWADMFGSPSALTGGSLQAGPGAAWGGSGSGPGGAGWGNVPPGGGQVGGVPGPPAPPDGLPPPPPGGPRGPIPNFGPGTPPPGGFGMAHGGGGGGGGGFGGGFQGGGGFQLGGGPPGQVNIAPGGGGPPMFWPGAANRTGGFDPADARTWGQFLAVPAQGISRNTQAGMEQLRRTLGPNTGAFRQAAGRLVNQGYGQIGGLRQNLAAGAIGDLGSMMSQSLGYNPAGPTGAAASAMSNLTNLRGQDIQNTQFGQNLGLQQKALRAQTDAALFSGLGSLLGGGLALLSDPRVKEKVKPHRGGLATLRRLSTYDWEYNGKAGTIKGAPKSGVMATDLKKALPRAVFEVKTNDPKLPRVKVVDYSVVLASTINAVKELDKKVVRLSALPRVGR